MPGWVTPLLEMVLITREFGEESEGDGEEEEEDVEVLVGEE